MAQHYSDKRRENESTALPDLEVFFHNPEGIDIDVVSLATCEDCDSVVTELDGTSERTVCIACTVGWYWWSCFPGCMPDGDPIGPFATEAEALADAREGMEDCE